MQFRDSLNLIGFSLEAIISSIHESKIKKELPLDNLFSSSKVFCNSMKYSQEQFEIFTLGKIPFPHSLITSYKDLSDITEIPPASAFGSDLRNTTTATSEVYNLFVKTWRNLDCQNLLRFLEIYNIADVCLFADAFAFIFQEIFEITGIWLSHYMTIASMSLESLLLNSREPNNPKKRLFIPYLSESLFETITSNTLTGGFSSNQSIYSLFNYGCVVPNSNTEDEAGIAYSSTELSFPLKVDYNRCLSIY